MFRLYKVEILELMKLRYFMIRAFLMFGGKVFIVDITE